MLESTIGSAPVVFISILPEAISSTTGLLTGGWKRSRILWMWGTIALMSGSRLSPVTCSSRAPHRTPRPSAWRSLPGAILIMFADTMMPEAFEHGGKLTGVVTTLGFAVAYAIHTVA